MLLNFGVGEDSWESLGLQEDLTYLKIQHWEDPEGSGIQVNPWLIHVNVWQKPLQHCKVISLQLIKIFKIKKKEKKKIPWCWERLRVGGEGGDRGRDGWMASLTHLTWVWVDIGRWWWIRKPGILESMGSQRVGHIWANVLTWTDDPFSKVTLPSPADTPFAYNIRLYCCLNPLPLLKRTRNLENVEKKKKESFHLQRKKLYY